MRLAAFAGPIARIIPHRCALCGSESAGRTLCPGCLTDIPSAPQPACPRCALPSAPGVPCGYCLVDPPPFTVTLAASTYAYPVDRMIRAVKYQRELRLLEPLGRLLADAVVTRHARRPNPELLLPVPPDGTRLARRGFDSATELAARLSAILAIPLRRHQCHRTRDAPAQASLPWRERRRNMGEVFACRRLDVDHVAIVDDVMTTGSSARAFARAILAAGATRVDVWVVARTLPPTDVMAPDHDSIAPPPLPGMLRTC